MIMTVQKYHFSMEENKHKTVIRYCKDTKTFLLICEKCFQALHLGRGELMPVDCEGDNERKEENFGGRIWEKVV